MPDKPTDGDSTPEAEFTVDEGAIKLASLLPEDDDVTPAPKDEDESNTDEDTDAGDEDQDDDAGDDDSDGEGSDEDTDSDEGDDDGDDEDDDAGDDDTPPTVTVTIDGNPVEVTLTEALQGYSRTADYTRKTQKLAEERKDFEAEKTSTREARDQYAERVKQLDEHLDSVEIKEPDWEKVRRETPEQFAQQHAEWQLHVQRRNAVKAERERVENEQKAEQTAEFEKYLRGQQEALHAALPDLADPAKRQGLKDRLIAHAETLGFTKEEVEAAPDHRALVLLSHSMQLAAIRSKADKVKDKAKDVPTIKPGARKTRKSKRSRQSKAARARLAKSGSLDDGAAALLDFDE
jgi:hypothetical protein